MTLASDVAHAQAQDLDAEHRGLDQLAGGRAAVELAGAVLAVLARDLKPRRG